MTNILRIAQLTKSYAERDVFRNLQVELGAGLHLLRGINGAGKSTLLAIIAGAEIADAGEIFVAGHEITREAVAAKQALAYVPDEADVYGFLTGEKFIQLVAAARGMKTESQRTRVQSLLEKFRIDSELDKRFDAMSLGMQKKFLLVAAFMDSPVLILLDEPTNGLDSDALGILSDEIADVAASCCVLVASHAGLFDLPHGEWRLHEGKMSFVKNVER